MVYLPLHQDQLTFLTLQVLSVCLLRVTLDAREDITSANIAVEIEIHFPTMVSDQ